MARVGLNELVRRHTAWNSFDRMVKSVLQSPYYRPTFRVDNPEQKRLADVFDAAMRRAGRPDKVAVRYGSYTPRRWRPVAPPPERPMRDVPCTVCGGTYKSNATFALMVCPTCLPAWQAKNAEEARKRAEERKEWERQGLRVPTGYDKPVELGGRCWDCDADWGGHKSTCRAVE